MRTAMSRGFWITMLAMALLLTGARAMADYEVVTRNDIVFAEHDGVKLLGDFYAPKGLDKAPVLVAVHGGGWQVGTRKFYSNWGPYLAKNGYAVFAIEYRLMKPDVKTYPGAVYDTKAAVQYVRANAGELGIDPERIGMAGDSAGAHLSALVALAGEEPSFSSEYRSDPMPRYRRKSRRLSASTVFTTCWRNGSTTCWRDPATIFRRNFLVWRLIQTAESFSRLPRSVTPRSTGI